MRTVAWPILSPAALHGAAGQIVNRSPHIPKQTPPPSWLFAEFGAAVGPQPHFVAGNDRHQAIINTLIAGRTNDGAKGTGLAVVDAIRFTALEWFDEFTTSSGVSSN